MVILQNAPILKFSRAIFAISILNPNYDVINEVISGFAKVVVERCGFHHWIAQRISWGKVVSVFSLSLIVPSYDVINDVIMSDADCTPGREPRSVAASVPLIKRLYTNPFVCTFYLNCLLSQRRAIHLLMKAYFSV